jgi:phenylacetic acid degradation protein
MDGAVIGEGAFVGALAFVPARFKVPPRMIAIGLPAKIWRAVTDKEAEWKASGTREYQELARRYRQGLVACAPLEAVEADRRRVDRLTVLPLHTIERG